jgi:hypothetical protein
VLVACRIPGARDRLVLGLTLGADRYRSPSQGRRSAAARSRAALERWCAAIGLVPQFTCADGLVILWQKGNAEAGLDLMRRLTGKLKLMMNEDKPPFARCRRKVATFWPYRRADILRKRGETA